MTDKTLMGEATPIFNPNETISIPASSVPNSKDNLYRLCEYDTEAQKGCRRTDTIFALEAEFDTFVDPEMEWGIWDLYCRHEGKTYYNKKWLETFYKQDIEVRSADDQNPLQVEVNDFLRLFTGKQEIAGADSIDYINELIQSPPPGFPKFVIETPQFYQFEDLGEKITIDQIDKPLLEKIKNSFSGSINPLLSNLNDRLFIKDDEVVCADLLIFDENATAKFGVIIIPTESEKYDINKAYFFAFSSLTPEQTDFIKKLTAMEGDFQRPVEIITL